MMHKLLLFLAAVLISSVAMAIAQQDVEVRFVAESVPKNMSQLVMATEEKLSEPFKLPLNHLSEPQKAPGRVFKLKLEKSSRVMGSVKLPEEGEKFIIILFPNKKTIFEVIVIPDNGGAFRTGDFYCHNISRSTVLGVVGKTKFALAPRMGKVVRPTGAVKNRFYNIKLGVRSAEKKLRVISTSRWPVGKQMRTYIFFFDNPKSKDVDFRAVDEFVIMNKKK